MERTASIQRDFFTNTDADLQINERKFAYRSKF